MRSHVKGSTTGQGISLGSFIRGAFVIRGVAGGVKGSRAPARARAATLVLALAAISILASSASATAACSNEAFRLGPSAHLTDCRGYEQASPTEKFGANIQHSYDFIYAATDGSAITFGDANGLPTTGGSSRPVIYAARRGVDGWSTNGLRPLAAPGLTAEINGWSQDLSTTINTAGEVTSGTLYFGNALTGTYTKVLDSTSPGSTVLATSVAGFAPKDPNYALFESLAVFAPGAEINDNNLYEYSHGAVRLAGQIPNFPATSCDDAGGPACIVAPAGAYAGPYDWVDNIVSDYGGARGAFYTPNVISPDGSRYFFTERGTGRLYVREDRTRTRQVSASQAATPDPNGEKPAAWVGAAPDGSKVFFLSCEKLTTDSTAVSTTEGGCVTAGQGQDLYEYDVDSKILTDLTVDKTAGDTLGANVVGFLGSSNDGSDAYFVANGVLAAGATPGNCKVGAGGEGHCNLYHLHNGTPTFITSLDPSGEPSDADNWLAVRPNGPSNSRTSRVSANGVLLFVSRAKLSPYENEKHLEIYRYSPGDAGPQCISCDPDGVAPLEDAGLFSIGVNAGSELKMKLLPRNLSADGNRIFFQSADQLVAEDVNGEGGCPINVKTGKRDCIDVYMWEANGSGSCQSSAQNGGCLSLISTGTSPNPSFFGDASASGDDVFFFTSQPLVSQDVDQLVDAYDARIDGGLASQYPPPPLPPCEGEACRTAGSATPPTDGAGTAVFQGAGNPPTNFKKCKQGRVLKKNRCVRRSQRARHANHKKTGRKGGGGK